MLSPMPAVSLDRETPASLETRFAASEAGIVEGYASTFGGDPDAYGDVIVKGAFAKSLKAMASEGRAPLMLWSHDPAEIVGRWTDLVEDDRGLRVKGKLNLDTQRGAEARALLREGDVTGLSIGFRLVKSAPGAGNVRRILQDLDLVEISVVGFPANRNARVTGAKSIGSKADLVDLLRGAGLAKGAAQKIAAGGYAALQSQDETEVTDLLRRIEAATGELKTVRG